MISTINEESPPFSLKRSDKLQAALRQQNKLSKMSKRSGDRWNKDSISNPKHDPSEDHDDNHRLEQSRVIDLTGSDDEDEDLKLAIALSLQDQPSSQEFQAQATTKSVSENVVSESHLSESQIPADDQETSSSIAKAPGKFVLDRKQMELERLARLKRKREPSITQRPVSPPTLRRKPEALTDQTRPIPARPLQSHQSSSSAVSEEMTFGADMTRPSSDHPLLRYPHGQVLLTSMSESQERSISLAQLLKPTGPRAVLKSAFLSTFIVDFDWLLPHFDTRNVSFVLALHAQNDQEKSLIQKDFEGIPNVRLVFPYVGGNVNCMHSKVMLLFYEDVSKHRDSSICRLVIPSANLVPWDWGVGGIMENVVFIIDLPGWNEDMPDTYRKDTHFKENLVQMLEAMGTPDAVIAKLGRYDFSKTEPYRFVHSIGGSHLLPITATPVTSNASIKRFLTQSKDTTQAASLTADSKPSVRTGKICLSDAVSSLGLDIEAGDASYPPRIDFVTSSLGNLNDSFLRSLFLAVCGRAPMAPDRTPKLAKTTKFPIKQSTDVEQLDMARLTNNIGIYFPSEHTIRKSKGGPASAGTICFQSKWWNAPGEQFPRKMLSDCVGVRKDGILMHSKVLFVRYASPKTLAPSEVPHRRNEHSSQPVETIDATRLNPSSSANRFAGWAYIGSANFSESAWGSLVTDSKTRQPKMNCRNWESGVLIPVPAKAEHEGRNLHNLSLQEVFGDIMPVPIEYPGTNLVESARQPWFFNG